MNLDFLNALTDFGFSKNTIKVYDAILQSGEASATAIARHADVPTSKVYSILEQLIEKEFCYVEQNPKRLFKLIDPSIGFKKLEHEQKSRLEKIHHLSERCADVFKQNSNETVGKSIKVITSKHAIMSTFYELFENTQQGAVAFMKGPYLTDLTKKNSLNSAQIRSIQNGCKYRTIYEIGEETEEDIQRIAKYFSAKGEEVRLHPKLPIKMALFDDTQLFIALQHNSTSGAIAIILNHPEMAGLFSMLFELFWEQAIDIHNS